MFNDSDSIFGEGDGVFEDEDSIFGDEKLDQTNPAVTLEDDMQQHSPPANVENRGKSTATMSRQPVALVAVYDENSQPLVARTVMKEGRPMRLEEYRRPTPDEYNAIMFGGKIVRGGVVGEEVSASTNERAALQKAPLGEWSMKKKVAVWALVGIGALGAGWGIYRWRKGKE